MTPICHNEAMIHDPRIIEAYRPGRLLVLQVCGFDRVGMIHQFFGDGDRIVIQFLMIDTLLASINGSRAWATFSADRIERPLTSWDMMPIRELMLPPRGELANVGRNSQEMADATDRIHKGIEDGINDKFPGAWKKEKKDDSTTPDATP